MGFGDIFRGWVRTLHLGAEAVFLLSRLSRSVPITFSVQQGDPLAMLLYIIQLEPFLWTLHRALPGLEVAGIVELAGIEVYGATVPTEATTASVFAKSKSVKREVCLAKEGECVGVLAAGLLTAREAACAREEVRLKVLAAGLASREAVIMAAVAGLTAVPGILDREAAVGGREAVVGGREASVAGREVAEAVREVAVGEGQRELDRQLSAAGMLVELHNLP